MHQRDEVDRQAFVAHHEPSEVLQPGDAALDKPAPSVAAELPAVLVRSDRVIRASGDDWFDPARRQPRPDRVAVVAEVPNQALRLPAVGGDALDRRGHQRHFRRGRRVHMNSERSTRAIGQYHELRSLAALGGPDQGPPFFATTKVPSMKHSSQRILSRSASSVRNARQRLSSVSSRAHWLNRRWTALLAPYRRGSSLHGAPVQSTHSSPSKHCRSASGGRPSFGLGVGGGSTAAILAHCPSVTWRHAMTPTPFSGTAHGVILSSHNRFRDGF